MNPSHPPPFSPPPPSPSSTTSSVGWIFGILGAVGAVTLPCVGYHLYRKWCKPKVSLQDNSGESPPLSPARAVPYGTIPYDELVSATNSFADVNVLGKGGFGSVYKGTLASGREVAIKTLNPDSKQGEKEFQAEVKFISEVRHTNLVTLVGYSIHGDYRLIVYEYVPNRTLCYHLHESPQPISWADRWKIALGTARGLRFLHEECEKTIIHRDIKATNILLDLNFEPKIADFGLARPVPFGTSHVSTQHPMGTIGYMAPEVPNSPHVTYGQDVYSYGVVLLELISGKDAKGLVVWAKPFLKRAIAGEISDEFIDKRLGPYNEDELRRLMRCAAAAVRRSPKNRPQMSQILQYLEGQITIQQFNALLLSDDNMDAAESSNQNAHTNTLEEDSDGED